MLSIISNTRFSLTPCGRVESESLTFKVNDILQKKGALHS